MNFRLSFWIGFGLEVGKSEIIFNIFQNWTNVYGILGTAFTISSGKNQFLINVIDIHIIWN